MLIINMVSEVWNSLQESFNCLCLQTVPLAVTLKVRFSHQKCLCLQDATNNRRSMLQVNCRQKHIFKTSKNDRRSMLQVDRQQTVPFALQHSPRLHSWSFPKHHATSGHCHQNNKNDCRSTLQTIVIENLNCLCLQTVPLAVERFKTIAVKSCRSSSKPIETRQQIVASSQSPSKSPIFTSKVHFSKLHTVVKTRQKRVKIRRSKTIVAPRCNR